MSVIVSLAIPGPLSLILIAAAPGVVATSTVMAGAVRASSQD
jgi:hypothetical protein